MLGFWPSAAGAFCARAATASSEASAHEVSLVVMVRLLSSFKCPVVRLRLRAALREACTCLMPSGSAGLTSVRMPTEISRVPICSLVKV